MSFEEFASGNPSIVYAVGPGVFKSTDGGMSWVRIESGLRGSVIDLVADPFSPNTLYASVWVPRGRRVYKTVDGAATWRPAAGGLSVDISVGQIVADPATPGTLYAATSRGVYVTRNGGALWTAMNDGLGDLPVWTVAVHPSRPGVVYAGRYDGLFEFSNAP